MCRTNAGGIDRALPIVLGLALLAGFFRNADATCRRAYPIGIMPRVTGHTGSCPADSLPGLGSGPMNKSRAGKVPWSTGTFR